MIILYILLIIILLIIVLLSIRFKIHFEYDNVVKCYAKWLFIKIPISPGKEKHNDATAENSVNEDDDLPLNEDTDENAEYSFNDENQKDTVDESVAVDEGKEVVEIKSAEISDNSFSKNTNEKDEMISETSDNEEKPINDNESKTEANLNGVEEKTTENTEHRNVITEKDGHQSDKPKPNSITDIKGILTTFYDNTGIDGVIELLRRLFTALNNYSRRMVHWFVCDEIYINAVIAKGDAAKTAESYGKYCSIIFPLFGNLISRFNVKKYDIDISPDYLASKGNATVVLTMSIIPRKIINSTVVLVFDLILRFLLKLFKHGRVPENTNNISENK